MVLYVKGELAVKDKNSVAIVGSRMTTHYGVEMARKLAYQLAYIGVTIVSGGARGIDTAAHQGALSAKGRTIAVMGTGINLIFPRRTRSCSIASPPRARSSRNSPSIARRTSKASPFATGLVAGMTLGTVVVEANLTSGALITARMANDNGRQVFAVPGRIDSPRSKGCHELIKNGGAKLCESAEDILSEFEYLFPASNRPSPLQDAPDLPAFALSPGETALYTLIDNEEMSIDDLIRRSGLAPSAVSVTLLGLEMKRLIRQLPGKIFVKNR